LFLAAAGLYGAAAHSTQQRMREFGVRMALGARSGQIVMLVLRQVGWMCLAGVPAGTALWFAGYRYYGATLLSGRPLELAPLFAGILAAAGTALIAALLPSIRASRVDAMDVLRSD